MSDKHWSTPLNLMFCRCGLPVIKKGKCWECEDLEKAAPETLTTEEAD